MKNINPETIVRSLLTGDTSVSSGDKLALLNAELAPHADSAAFSADLLRLAFAAMTGKPVALIASLAVDVVPGGYHVSGQATCGDLRLGQFELQVAPDGQGSLTFDGTVVAQTIRTPRGMQVRTHDTQDVRAALLRVQAVISLGRGTFRPAATLHLSGTHLERGVLEEGGQEFQYVLRQTETGEGLLAVNLGRGYTEAARATVRGKDVVYS